MRTSRRVRVGVVGCGVVATAYYLPYLANNADLIAVCDLDQRRTEACARLFGAKQQYSDFDEMLKHADIEAVVILTAPGTHVRFTEAAVAARKHILLQKPLATNLQDAQRIVQAIRNAKVKALIEPSQSSPLDPQYPPVRRLVKNGTLGRPYYFSLLSAVPEEYGPSLGGNPYGAAAFYAADSGGFLFDYAYGPNKIATVLGTCKAVTAMAKVSVPENTIVPDSEFDRFLAGVTDPAKANYWDVVVDLPRTQEVRMEAADNVYSIYEMESGAIGVFHCARPRHPQPHGWSARGLEVFGTDGNLFMGGGNFASIISTRQDLLPEADPDGWYRIPARGDLTKAEWPKPIPGGFHYYHESCREFLASIVEDRDPFPNPEWGLHVTEMMFGALESVRTGRRYEMVTRLPDEW